MWVRASVGESEVGEVETVHELCSLAYIATLSPRCRAPTHCENISAYRTKTRVYGYSSSQSNLPHRYGNSHAI